MSENIVYRWVGGNGYVPGIPKGSISQAVLDRLMQSDPTVEAKLKASPLYEAVKPAKVTKAKATVKPAATAEENPKE